MIIGTILIVIFTPALYAIVQKMREWGGVKQDATGVAPSVAPGK